MKVSFRSRAFDVNKPLPIYTTDELSKLPNREVTSREVPQMPSGMEKSEENELHLREAITCGHAIPIPHFETEPDKTAQTLEVIKPKKLIQQSPFPPDNLPNYDVDSEDETFLKTQTEIEVTKFEHMIESFEKQSTHNVITCEAAKDMFSGDGVITMIVYEYWLNKRLRTKLALIPTVPNQARPHCDESYVAFRKRFDKRVTRRNRRNDEVLYFKMIRLRDDLRKATELLGIVKQREEVKKEMIRTQIQIFEKRFEFNDEDDDIYGEILREVPSRVTPFSEFQYVKLIPRKMKKHKMVDKKKRTHEEEPAEIEDENHPFVFRRKLGCSYLPPTKHLLGSNLALPCQIFPMAVFTSKGRDIIFGSRRIGRGGRIILDRITVTNEQGSELENRYNVLKEIDTSDIETVERLSIEVEDLENDAEAYRTEIDVDHYRQDKENSERIHCRGKRGFTDHLSDIRYIPTTV